MNGYIHAMEYYLAIKRREICIQAITWMNFKYILLNKINQTPKATYILSDSIYMTFWKKQNHRNGEQMSGYPGLGLVKRG